MCAAATPSGSDATRSPPSPRRRPSSPANPGTDAVATSRSTLAEVEARVGGQFAGGRLGALERPAGVGSAISTVRTLRPSRPALAPVHVLWNSSANSGNVANRNAVKPGRDVVRAQQHRAADRGKARTPPRRPAPGRRRSRPPSPARPSPRRAFRRPGRCPSAGRRPRCGRRTRRFPDPRRAAARGSRRCPPGSTTRSPAR